MIIERHTETLFAGELPDDADTALHRLMLQFGLPLGQIQHIKRCGQFIKGSGNNVDSAFGGEKSRKNYASSTFRRDAKWRLVPNEMTMILWEYFNDRLDTRQMIYALDKVLSSQYYPDHRLPTKSILRDVGLQAFLEALRQEFEDQVLPQVNFDYLSPLVSIFQIFELMDKEKSKIQDQSHMRRLHIDFTSDSTREETREATQKRLRDLKLVTAVILELVDGNNFETGKYSSVRKDENAKDNNIMDCDESKQTGPMN
jgi:hypothetical protein